MPSNNALGVPLESKVEITFNEDMDGNTLNKYTFLVKKGSTVIDGSYEYADRKVTFKPSVKFEYNYYYTVTMTTDVKDAGGSNLTHAYSYSFKTIANKTAEFTYDVPGTYDLSLEKTASNITIQELILIGGGGGGGCGGSSNDNTPYPGGGGGGGAGYRKVYNNITMVETNMKVLVGGGGKGLAGIYPRSGYANNSFGQTGGSSTLIIDETTFTTDGGKGGGNGSGGGGYGNGGGSGGAGENSGASGTSGYYYVSGNGGNGGSGIAPFFGSPGEDGDHSGEGVGSRGYAGHLGNYAGGGGGWGTGGTTGSTGGDGGDGYIYVKINYDYID